MAADAIEGFVASLAKHGEPIPSDEENLISSVEVSISRRLAHG